MAFQNQFPALLSNLVSQHFPAHRRAALANLDNSPLSKTCARLP